MPDLSIIVVNWNTLDLLRACLKSVLDNQGGLDVELFVVDNASEDGSQAMVKAEFPSVHLIENDENVGFAIANNQAMPLCNGRYIMLLNSDAEILGDAMQVLVAYLDERTEVGAIGPKVVHPAMRLQVLSCGMQPTVRTLFNQYFFLSRLFPENKAFLGINLLTGIHDDRPRSVEWLSGVCFVARKAVIEQVGVMSTDWFMYAEDLEWSLRMTNAGWELHHVPTAVIDHHFGASTNKNKTVKTMWVPNMVDYFKKTQNPGPMRVFLFNTVFLAGLALRAVIYKLRALVDSKNRTLWQDEAQKFFAYSRAALANF